jgi:hypothetical protein
VRTEIPTGTAPIHLSFLALDWAIENFWSAIKYLAGSKAIRGDFTEVTVAMCKCFPPSRAVLRWKIDSSNPVDFCEFASGAQFYSLTVAIQVAKTRFV